MKLTVLEHGRESQLGLLGEWARSRGHLLDVVGVLDLSDWPEPGQSEAIVSLGSNESVHTSKEPWIEAEVEFLRSAHEERVPILGICFGAQALAAALGGTVESVPRPQVAWEPLASRRPDLVPPGPWFRWHDDVFSTPPGAREIARSSAGSLAFEIERSIGLQFHPEADEALVHKWIADASRRSAAMPDERALVAEVKAASVGAPARAADLFDRIVALWRAGGDRPA